MVQALAGLGHRVDLLTYPQGEAFAAAGVRHRRSLALPVGRVKAGPSLAKLLLDVPFACQAWLMMLFGGYDAVHAVEEAAHLVAPLAYLIGLPLVMDVDSQIPDQLRYSGFATRGPLLKLAGALEAHALRGAAVVITVCRSLTEGVARTAPRERVFQIEDPPLVDRQPVDPSAVLSLRGSLGLSAAPIVFYSGNFEPYQGVELLVDAAARVPEAQFVLMGGETPEIDALRARAGGGRCVFVGTRPPQALPAFLALADVVASPRLRGANTPFKVYTYLASGKPLVATRLPTHTQLLDDSLAFLVEPSPDGLAAGIRAVLGDPGAAAERARRGLALIEREYSPKRFEEKVGAAYAALTPRRAS
jgi:glycosyltransferase involved in cell wall biosynthesis